MRSGAAWDAACVVAVAAPAAGVLAPLAGRVGRDLVVRAGRWGSLAAVGLWALLAAAEVRPTLGGFDPDPATLAALAGVALVAATLAADAAPDHPIDPAATLAPPAAVVVLLLLGLVDAPTDLATGPAALVALGAAAVASLAALAARGARGPVVLAALLGPAALLVAVRAGRLVGTGDLSGVAAFIGPLAALVAGAAAVAAPRRSQAALLVGPFLVVAAALAPLPEARSLAALLAAGAVLATATTDRWSTLALAPGLAGLLVVAADVPAPGAEAIPHAVWALGLAAAAVGLVRADTATAAGVGAVPVEATAACGALVAWLLLTPARWSWAAPPVDLLEPWDRAAAVAAAAVLVGGVLAAALPHLPRRGGPRPPVPLDRSPPGLPG